MGSTGQVRLTENASAAYIRWLFPPSFRRPEGQENADRTPFHQGRSVSLRGDRIPADHVRDSQPRRLGGVQGGRRRGAGGVVAGRLRRAGAEIFPQGGRPLAPEEGRGRNRSLVPVALGRRRGRARRIAGE